MKGLVDIGRLEVVEAKRGRLGWLNGDSDAVGSVRVARPI